MSARPNARRNVATETLRPNDSGFAFVAVLLAACVVACTGAVARAADEDLPGRVGRVADFAGQLYLSPDDRATEWQPIGLNYPVASADNLWVSGDGRAEVDYGGGQFRLAGDTNLHVSRLDENQIALFVAQGGVIVRVRALDPGDSARIDVPNTQIQLTRSGLYRIDVEPDRQVTRVTVREGEAQVATTGGVQQALPGQLVIVRGPDASAIEVISGTGQDGFDAWSASRDRYYERARSTAYVSSQMVGAADLDNYGVWETTPEYGPVWYPGDVAPDWAPYRVGYWTTVGPFGYTWVDYAPWGYAPFHYGRWVYVGRRWGWCPGAYVARPVWAPALVAWVGGPGWGFSATVGGPVYGWVPLAWGEPYQPWWRRCSQNCWVRYNRPYAVNVTVRTNAPPPRYRNIGAPNAVTVVSATTLAGHAPVAKNLVRVPPQQLSAAPVMRTAPAVAGGPLHVPAVRAGSAGTPQPASTFYPVARQRGATLPTHSTVPAAGGNPAPSGDATMRRAPGPTGPAAPPSGASTRTNPRGQGLEGAPPARGQGSSRQPPAGGSRTAAPPEGGAAAPPATGSRPEARRPPASAAAPAPQPQAAPGAPMTRQPPARTAPSERAAPAPPHSAPGAPPTSAVPPSGPAAPRSGGQGSGHAGAHEEGGRAHQQANPSRDPNAPGGPGNKP